jgi:hypothetical protein
MHTAQCLLAWLPGQPVRQLAFLDTTIDTALTLPTKS